MGEKKRSISVRLSVSLVKELDVQAKARGLIRADYLRHIIFDAVTFAHHEETKRRLDDLERAIENLRHKLATATSGILLDLQTIEKKQSDQELTLTPQEIKTWVRNNILR